MWPLRGIYKTVWGAKLILMANLAYHVGNASLGHLLMAQHCRLCLNACFSQPTAPHLPPPTRPPLIDSICDITAIKKLPQKPGTLKCGISYEISAI